MIAGRQGPPSGLGAYTRRMARILPATVMVAASLACRSVEAPAPHEHGTEEARAMVERLYRAFCFDAGGEADWTTMRSLFAPGASFVDPFPPGRQPVAVDAERFLASFAAWCRAEEVRSTGLHERIMSLRLERCGGIAHAWVGFEGFQPIDGRLRTRGVDSLQLVLDRGEWKLASFTTQYSTDDAPLPSRWFDAAVDASAR